MGEESPSAAERVARLWTARSKRIAAATFIAKLLIVIGTGGVTFYQVATAGDPRLLDPGKMAGIFATTLIFLAALFLLSVDHDATEALGAAKEAVDEAGELIQALSAFDQFAEAYNSASYLYVAMLQMGNALESMAQTNLSDDEIAATLLDVARRSLSIAMRFDYSDHTTICIYRADRQTGARDILRLVAHSRTLECTLEEARSWPVGVGVAGIAYAKEDEVIIPDMSASDLGTVLDLGRSKPEDEDLYRSMVAVPVLVGPQQECWGVVLASSDQENHFPLDDVEGDAAEGVRALAAMLAAGIARRYTAAPPEAPVASGAGGASEAGEQAGR
jgi:hypothetical protein